MHSLSTLQDHTKDKKMLGISIAILFGSTSVAAIGTLAWSAVRGWKAFTKTRRALARCEGHRPVILKLRASSFPSGPAVLRLHAVNQGALPHRTQALHALPAAA